MWAILFCVLAFSGCDSPPSYDSVEINSLPECEAEAAFVEALLSQSGLYEELKLKLATEEDAPKIHIDFYFATGNAAHEGIPVSRTTLVPRAEAHAFREETSLADCL
ncbi:MAG: hypothetical protein LBU82_03065 [Treponema sp.]|jgi:hypothetical protein|nr:hypothetical protein [Treponema sp.]